MGRRRRVGRDDWYHRSREGLPESPEVINEDPYGDGWLIKVQVSDPSELEDLMDGEEYEDMVAKEKE